MAEQGTQDYINPVIVDTKKETDRKCPQCGGVMDFDPREGKLHCPYCDYLEEILPDNEEETAAEIKSAYDGEGYLIDPHTAVGLGCVKKYRADSGDMTPVVLASTASPYKFAPAVADAIGVEYGDDIFALLDDLSAKTGTEVPAPLAGTRNLSVRFEETVNPTEMPDVVFRV